MEEKRVKPGKRDLIRQATESLKIRDIFLFQCHMARPTPFPDAEDAEIERQGRHGIRMALEDISENDDESNPVVQFFVLIGMRLVAPGTTHDADDESEEGVYLEIEAEYLVEYEIINKEVSKEALKSFAEFNVLHNVWPFWRQHVYDMVQRGGLPRIDVPLFSGIKF